MTSGEPPAPEAPDSGRPAKGIDDWLKPVVDALTAVGTVEQGVHQAAAAVASALEADSVLVLGQGLDFGALHLLASSDEVDPPRPVLMLESFPEVRRALETGEPVFVGDVSGSELMVPHAAALADRGIAALLAAPLPGTRSPGVLLVRFSDVRAALSHEQLTFVRLAAMVVGVALRSGRLLEPLRETTRRVTLQDINEERRSRAIERHRDFLEAASDGMVAVDAEGRVLYINRAAEAITGYARSGLQGKPLIQIVPERLRAAFSERIAAAVRSEPVANFDLDLVTTSGDRLTVWVASIGILSEHEAAILAFRDVTEARELENALRDTKEFLERIIDSTVDAIVAGDMRGHVLLFNQAAERLFGHRAADAVGKLSVKDLYPPGASQEIMRLLRSAEHGGSGRLESVRREVKGKSGEVIPVNLSAAIVFDGAGKEIATVGVLSDLRERLRMEERLASAQERLAVTQKHAVAMELAGAAAHELNQPLTSVMGYAEMLRKKLGADSPHHRLVDTISQEAERMAGIVRQLGSLTRYETKSYVGGAQIIDLDRSSASLPVLDPDELVGSRREGGK